MSCDVIRPQLGELLLGALDDPEPLLEHVADCADCARALAELQELDAALFEPAAAAPVRAGWRWPLLYLGAAAAALLVGALLARQLAPALPSARVLDGSARLADGRAAAGEALNEGRVVAGAQGLTLRLADGSTVRAAPGAALTLTAHRALRLHRGRARFSVVPDPTHPFRVETPRAPVRVLGTVFDVDVEEVVVAGTGIKAAGLAAVVGVSVLTGAVVFGDGGDAVEVRQGQAAVADAKGVRRVAVGAQAVEAAQEAQRAAEAEQAALSTKHAALEAETAALRAELAELKSKLGQPAAEAPDQPPPAEPQRRVFTFGDPSPERAKLTELDWETPAAAVGTMVPLLKQYFDALSTGEQPDQELQVAIYKANSKLVEAYLEVRGKLPTHAQANGEYAHPAFMANLLDAYLESAGQPLDEVQRDRVGDLGRRYDASWGQLQASYTEQTPLVRKILDEVRLKAEFRAGVDQLLTPQQLTMLGDEQLRHVSGMDLFSPVLVFTASTQVVAGANADELRSQLHASLSALGIDPATPGVEQVLGSWLAAAVGPPVPAQQLFTLNDALRALGAQADAFEQLGQLALNEEQLTALHSSGRTILPRLNAPE